uniref:4Fe-4S cluster-binding domain-containing protein n=1 Tax=candidate division CPR3 bacterium TaxID=2268181 RepID=A0A7C4R4S4_UNCC3
MKNIFENPKKYLEEILEKNIFPKKEIEKVISDHDGLSMICAWITKKCPLSCEKCFFKSNMDTSGMIEEEHTLTDEGIKKLIKFASDSNSGYLMLSGGGDPMIFPEKVNNIIEKTKTKRIVVVTSGFWAKSIEKSEKIIDSMYNALKKSKTNDDKKVILRISVDRYHSDSLGGIDPYINIIKIFNEKYKKTPDFKLMIHTMKGDMVIWDVAEKINGKILIGEQGESDNRKVIKIVPQKAIFKIDSDYEIEIGISKLFLSDLLVDLRKPYSNSVKEAVKVLTEDMENSEQDNPSYIQNANGKKGLDFWVDYNGNVTTWFNQDWNNLFNLYTDKYKNIVLKTFSSPISARFIKKGYQYRNGIVNEVNPKALLRSQAINLRDYAGAFLIEEDKTKLYYAIRSIQDYISDFILNKKDIEIYSPEIQEAILSEKTDLIEMYHKSKYDITNQYLIGQKFNKEKWEDFLKLIKLGHYDISRENLKNSLKIYNEKTGNNKEIDDFNIEGDSKEYIRFHKRISFMKPESLEYCKNKSKKNEKISH